MTVDSKYDTVVTYINDGGTEYPYPFESIGEGANRLYKVKADGTETLLTEGFHYNITFSEYRGDIPYRGTINLVAPLAAGSNLRVERKTPITNTLEFSGIMDPQQLEYAFDKICFIEQEIEGHFCDCRGLAAAPPAVSVPGTGPPLPECLPYDCAALEDAYELYFRLEVPPMIAGPLSEDIPWVGDVFPDVVVASQSATTFSWSVFTDFTNGGFGPGAFGIRPVEDDITGWSLCGGIVEEGFAIDTTGAFFNSAGVFVPGRFNADSGSGVIGLGENQNVRFEGGTVFETWLYVLADYSQNDVPDTTHGSVRVRFNIVWDTSEYVLQVEGLGSTIELSLPSGVFPTPTSDTIGFAPWNAEVSFSNYRWDLSSGRRVVCNAAYRLAVNGTTLEGTVTGIDLGGVIDFGIQIVPGPVTPVDPTVSAGVPTNAFGTDVPFSYFPTSFYPDFIGFIGYFILGDERTIALEDVTAFETAYARTFADYAPPSYCSPGTTVSPNIP
jgi:hypothetical protein